MKFLKTQIEGAYLIERTPNVDNRGYFTRLYCAREFKEAGIEIAFSEKVDYLGVDAGSTDPGPYYLGSGKSFTDRGAVKRDLSLALPKALEHKAPFIIGTAGGAGSSEHVLWLKDIILEIAKEKNIKIFLNV